MIRFLGRLALHIMLVGLVTACGGGGSSGGGGGGGDGGGGGGGTPPPVTLSSITVTPASASVVAGLTLQFSATGNYSDGTTKDLTTGVNWTSSDPSKAMIIATSGLATGAAAGSVTITATYTNATTGTVKGDDALTVAPPNLLSVTLSPNKPTVPLHRIVQFAAIGSYTDGSTKDLASSVTWSTSAGNIVSIDSSGAATAEGAGASTISASIAGGPTITPVTMTVTSQIYAYATNIQSDTVSQYAVSMTDGSLTPLSTPTVASGRQPFSISVEPSGEYVYVANYGGGTISQYRIGDDGTLTALPDRDVAAGAGPNSVTLDHKNRYAYVADIGSTTISEFNIGLDGKLTPMAVATVAAGANPATIVLDPQDKFAYAGNFGAESNTPPAGPGQISQYSVGSDGSLKPLSTATVASGSGPNAIAIDPTSHYLYVANVGDSNVGQYTINTDGTLTAMLTPTVGTGAHPSGIVIDPTGAYVYTANGDGTVSQFLVSSIDGSLTAMATPFVTAGTGTVSVTIDPTGHYLYATNRGTTTVSQFTIGAGGGLVPMTTPAVQAGNAPTSIATGY